MKTPALTETQKAIFLYAIEHTEGVVIWTPPEIKGGARQKVLTAMINRGLVEKSGDNWSISALSYSLLGLEAQSSAVPATQPPAAVEDATDHSTLEQDVQQAEAQLQIQEQAPAPVNTRANSKQAQVIALLQRPEGATVKQICALTQWQAHTVRGMFAGAFKKKLGLEIASAKPPGGGDRVYTIANRQG